MGFRVEPDLGKGMNAFGVALLSSMGMCMWSFALFGAAKHPEKLLWWSLQTKTRAVEAV